MPHLHWFGVGRAVLADGPPQLQDGGPVSSQALDPQGPRPVPGLSAAASIELSAPPPNVRAPSPPSPFSGTDR